MQRRLRIINGNHQHLQQLSIAQSRNISLHQSLGQIQRTIQSASLQQRRLYQIHNFRQNDLVSANQSLWLFLSGRGQQNEGQLSDMQIRQVGEDIQGLQLHRNILIAHFDSVAQFPGYSFDTHSGPARLAFVAIH